jgi:hypothetical protein
MSGTDDLRLTWPGGPTLDLSATRIIVAPSESDRSDPEDGSSDRLDVLLFARMWRPTPLSRVRLEFDGRRLLYYRTKHMWEYWEVPPDQIEAVGTFVNEFVRRREAWSQHHGTPAGRRGDSRGRSLLPWIAAILLVIWLIRRARRR